MVTMGGYKIIRFQDLLFFLGFVNVAGGVSICTDTWRKRRCGWLWNNALIMQFPVAIGWSIEMSSMKFWFGFC